jgi:hypothetical protein
MSHRSDVAAIVKRQDGLITHRQAIQSGITADALRGLRARGEWISVLPQVYRVVESHQTADSNIRAASLWAGQPACVSGIAAASWWVSSRRRQAGWRSPSPELAGSDPVQRP